MADNMTAAATSGLTSAQKMLADSIRASIERDKQKIAQQPTGKGDLLPIHYFAPEIQSLITSLAASLQTPRDFITASLMTVYGVALGANIEVFIDGQYHNKPNLWAFLCAEPTANKTAAMKSLIAPLLDMQTQYDADYKGNYAEWKRAKKNGDNEQEEPVAPYLIGSSATLEKQCKGMKYISLRLSSSQNFWARVLAWFRAHVGSAEDCAAALHLGTDTVDCQIIDLLRSGLIVPAPSVGQHPHYTGKEAHDEKRQFRFL